MENKMDEKRKIHALVWFVIERIFLCLAILSLAQSWWVELTKIFVMLSIIASTLGLECCDL